MQPRVYLLAGTEAAIRRQHKRADLSKQCLFRSCCWRASPSLVRVLLLLSSLSLHTLPTIGTLHDG
jgi:hypothetical protein